MTDIRLSVASYSFHKLLESGKQDMFKYITDCKELGCAQLDPWNETLAPIFQGDEALRLKKDYQKASLSTAEVAYLKQVKAAAEKVGLPFGCICVDGAHIYEQDPVDRQVNRAVAYRWLEAAQLLEASQVRIDSGGPEELTEDVLKVIVEGYRDVITRAQGKNLEVIIENHWGPSRHPQQLLRILAAVKGLGLLFDSGNWAPGTQVKGWELTSKFARAVHIKARPTDEQGKPPEVYLPIVIRLLVQAGYRGTWGVESVPKEGDEFIHLKWVFGIITQTLNTL